jgi:SET domain-containing protein
MTAKLKVRRSRIYAMGCFALAHFPARRKIALYAGEIVRGGRRIEARLRAQEAVKVIRLSDDLAIDGAVGGDETAYINHSCEPNAYMRAVPGDKVAFFALRDISPGEEVTVDYRDSDHPEVCRCGAEKCRSKGRRRKRLPVR